MVPLFLEQNDIVEMHIMQLLKKFSFQLVKADAAV